MNSTIALMRNRARWLRRLPYETELLFLARTPIGRSAKIAWFGLGVLFPLGSLIWVLLFWHGTMIRQQRR